MKRPGTEKQTELGFQLFLGLCVSQACACRATFSGEEQIYQLECVVDSLKKKRSWHHTELGAMRESAHSGVKCIILCLRACHALFTFCLTLISTTEFIQEIAENVKTNTNKIGWTVVKCYKVYVMKVRKQALRKTTDDFGLRKGAIFKLQGVEVLSRF